MKQRQNYSKQVNSFTKNVGATLQVNNISNQEFQNDIVALKNKQLSNSQFQSKYSQLFDGTFSKYKDTNSFLGSYRRNTNPKYFKQSKDLKVRQWNQELRQKTVIVRVIKPKKKVIHKPHYKRKISKGRYYDKTIYKGFARDKVAKLKNVWQIKYIIDNNLFSYQWIHIVICVDICYIKDNKVKILTPNVWITFNSGIARKRTLLDLYDDAYKEYLAWLDRLEQSKLFANIKEVYTHVYRKGG